MSPWPRAPSRSTRTRPFITSTRTSRTPGSGQTAFSTAAAQAAQSMPPTRSSITEASELLFDMLEPIAQQAFDVVVVEAVVDRLAFLAASDQAELAEDPQRMRHRGLAHGERGGQVADAELFASQRVDQPQTVRIPKRAERLGQKQDSLGRFHVLPRPTDLGEVGDLDLAEVIRNHGGLRGSHM